MMPLPKQISPKRLKGLDNKLVESARLGALAELSAMLDEGADPASISAALSMAADSGQKACVQMLIPLCNPKNCSSQALRHASYSGHPECVKALIPCSDPAADDSYALRWAARKGHAECIKLLIPFCDPADRGFATALAWAAGAGRLECLSLLASIGPAKLALRDALSNAARSGRAECVSMLLPLAKISEIVMAKIFRGVVEAGCVQVAVSMLAYQPRLLRPETFSDLLNLAAANKRDDLSALLCSVIEQRELALSTGQPAPLPLKSPRL